MIDDSVWFHAVKGGGGERTSLAICICICRYESMMRGSLEFSLETRA